MTERKSSYLTGLSLANQYAALGAFKGNAAADFGAMLLFRSATPFNGFGISSVPRFLCGNLQAVASNNTKGWGLRWLAGSQPAAQLELIYGDNSLAQQTFVARPLTPTQMAQRTMLVHVFLLTDPALTAPDNVEMLLYVNGALVARTAGLSFTPADGTGTFRIGGASINGSSVDAPGIGASGFAYCSTIAGASLAAKLATIQAMVDATTAQSLETGDVADDALVTNLFSVRQALPDPRPSWVPSKGAISLARVGSSALSVEAANPLFGDVSWEDLTPIPDPLQILGAANIIGWWDAAHSIVAGGLAAGATDLSGNGRPLGQATAGERFAIANGIQGLPAWQADGTPQSLFVTGLPPVLGDKNTLWLVARADPTVAAFGSAACLSNALITLVPFDLGVVLAQYFGQINTTGGFGAWLSGIAPGTPHVFGLLTAAGAASMQIDGSVIPPTVGTTGGISVTSPRFELGAGSVAVAAGQVPWKGQIYEALLTGPTALTAAQITALDLFFRSKYEL